MKTILTTLLCLLFLGPIAKAAEPEGSIVEIVKRLPEARSPIPEKEFYLNIGETDQVAMGDVFNVYRKLPITDVLTGEALEFLPVIIGEIQVTNLGKSSSVARLVAMAEFSALPKIDYPVIMLGDRVKRKTGLPFK